MHQALVVILDMRNLNSWIRPGERLAEFRRHHWRERAEAPNAQRAPHRTLRLVGDLVERGRLSHNAPHLLDYFSTNGCEGESLAMVSHEERDLQLAFHLGDG
jgi:hypothetical protein